MSSTTQKTLHIAMYPWFAMGHLTAFMHLANRFADKGHKISFFVPIKTQPKVASHNHHPDLIKFVPITVPHVEGLPVGAETTNDVSAQLGPKIMEAMDLTQDTIDSHLANLKPDYVFFDFTQWLPGIARKHGAKSLYYASSYIVSMAYFDLRARGLPEDHNVTAADVLVAPPGFPCPAMWMRTYEANALLYVLNMEFGGGMTLVERHEICSKECDVVTIKTCREMEGAYCDFIDNTMFGKAIQLVGPVVPEPPTSTLDEPFNGWLNGFSQGSVVFCALGSECVLEFKQFHELVLGLELTGRPFLAALKPPRGYQTLESALPEGYLERTKGRGMIHEGWIQQQLILHHPSVGCFITHCGAGSLSEALLSECQLVLLPQAVDQFINARLMSLDLRVGVEVDKGDEDGFFTKESVYESIHTVMDPENEIGKQVRENHTKWRETLLKPGLEDSYINELLKSLQDMLG